MKVFVCIKHFKESSIREVLGVFSTRSKAKCFAKEFPTFSMDDPKSFKVFVKPYELNETVWGNY